MFVILAYDVRVKRVAKTNKICKKYLKAVQRSVFEGDLTEKKLIQLQNELKRNLKPEEDSVCIYCMESMRFAKKYQIGPVEVNPAIL